MGFFDSMKGFFGGVADVIGGVVRSPIGQQFLGAGLNIGFEKLFGQPAFGAPPPRQFNPGGSRVNVPRRAPPSPQFQSRAPVFRRPPQMQLPTFTQPPLNVVPAIFGGAQMPHFPGDRIDPGVLPVEFDIPGFDVRSPFVGQGRGADICAPMFRPTVSSISPAPLVMVPNPMTGAPTFFKHAGKPILFSGDLKAAKMVGRLARRARRATPRR